MGNKVSQFIKVAGLSSSAARNAVEAFETDFDTEDFVSLWYGAVRSAYEDGQYKPQLPIGLFSPEVGYDALEFTFNATFGGTVSSLVLTIATLMPDGNVIKLGTVTYASGVLPVTKIPWVDTPIYIYVSAISGSGAELSTLDTYVRGIPDTSVVPLSAIA